MLTNFWYEQLMSDAKAIADPFLSEHYPPLEDGFTMSAELDAHIRTETQKTLDAKAAGTMEYHSLESVMREFGFHAR
ncbi:MAG: hypothetical protein AAGH87_10690 [Pseudomonadota bacterium]